LRAAPIASIDGNVENDLMLALTSSVSHGIKSAVSIYLKAIYDGLKRWVIRGARLFAI
jgi:hypothetical protein